MKLISLAFWVLLSAVLWVFGTRSVTISGQSIPPLIKIFSPSEGFWYNARQADTQLSDDLSLTGLNNEVEVYFDSLDIPHIYADNRADAFRAQGYIHAVHRLWQLDITSRATAGRLAEIMGKNLIDFDKKARRKGMLKTAKRFTKLVEQDAAIHNDIQSYLDGVNAYQSQLSYKNYPIEYKLLDYAPQEYTLEDMMLLVVSMADALSGRVSDLAYSDLANVLDMPTIDKYFPLFHDKDVPIIPDAEVKSLEINYNIPQEIIGLDIEDVPAVDNGIGSNNWVIDSSRSAHGGGILADDPHLPLTLPSIWHQAHMVTRDMNVYGVSLPGAPGIVIGFNDHIAWGVTNMGHDVIDHYMIRWVDSTRTQYYYDGQKLPITYELENIAVRDGKPVTDSIPYTRWGPLFMYDDEDPKKASIAMRWIIHEKTDYNILKSFIGLNESDSYNEFKSYLKYFEAPGQNFVFLSKEEEIALHPQAKYIIRNQGRGQFIYPGDTSASEWLGFIDHDKQPYAYNPDQGYLASANQITVSEKTGLNYFGFFADYRSRSINHFLASDSTITIDDFKSYQLSNRNIYAEELYPAFMQAIDRASLNNQAKQWYDTLFNWNVDYERFGLAPTLFEKWDRSFKRMYYDESIFDNIIPHRVSTVQAVNSLEKDPFFDRVDTPERETKEDLIRQSFHSVFDTLSTVEPWGVAKRTLLRHLGRIPAFSIPVNTSGHRMALNAQSSTNGPSWRMIVSFNPTLQAYGVYPGGQSGDPASPHYTDMVDAWVEGRYYPLQQQYSAEDCQNQSYRKLAFKP